MSVDTRFTQQSTFSIFTLFLSLFIYMFVDTDLLIPPHPDFMVISHVHSYAILRQLTETAKIDDFIRPHLINQKHINKLFFLM